ncbi:neuroblast differentiation-associated protein AHNAK [Eleginops maclovinus]|uniref:neuroblast differentiation-associated protein AHNAK n=1 Tax=Eleginops maclovinus TaxID=56733 RepID=UPI00308024F6
MMSEDSSSRRFSESLILDNSKQGVVITGITDDRAAKSGLRAGDEIVAATIHLDHLNKDEVLNVLKALEPYDDNMKVLTKKQLNASAGLGSLGLDLDDPSKMLSLKEDLSLDASSKAPAASVNELMGKLNGSNGLGGEIGGATINGGLPGLSLNEPSADAGAKFRMPSFGMSGPDVNGELDGTLKASDVSVSAPKLNTPSASLDIGKPGIKTGNQKYKPPKFTMPHFNLPQLKTPKAKMDVSGDVNLPSANVETPDLNLSAPRLDLNSPGLDLNGPKMNLNGPAVNLETPNADFEAPKIKWPHFKWKGPKVKGPDADLNADLSAPDVSLNTPKIDADLKLPALDVESPNLDIDAPSVQTHWPHSKWKLPKLNGPKADLDLDPNLNTPNLNASLPNLDGEINGPDVDINLPKAEVGSLDLNSSKVQWPHQKWKMPKFKGPKADMDLNTPDLNVSTPKIDGDINVPNAELNLPRADINGPNVDLQSPNFAMEAKDHHVNWPHLKWKKPKLHGPKADLNADLSTPDVDLSVPKIDGDLNLPRADVDVTAPGADLDSPHGRFKFPTLRKPKFLLPKVKGPDVDLDANVKAPDLSISPQASLDMPDVDLNLPNAGVDVKAPNVDIDAPSGKVKWPTLKKPKWSLAGPKVNGLDADVSAPDLNLTSPKIDGEINAPNLTLPDADLEVPKLDIDGPDVEGPSGKMKWFNFKKPTFGTLKGPKGEIEVPDVDLKTPEMNLTAPDFSAPKIEGGLDSPDFDINLPKANLKGPAVDLQAPELDASAGKIKFPKIDLPKFGLSGPRVKGPDLNLDANAPNLNLSAPSIKGNLSTPDLDVDTSLKTGIDLSGPQTTIGVPDVNLSTPDVKAPQVNLNLPRTDVKGPSMALPKADFSVPDLNLNAPDISLSSPNIDGKLSAPNIDTGLPNVDLNLPKADIKVPDAQLKTPGIGFDSHVGEFNMPHFNLPNVGLSSPKVRGIQPSVEAGIEAPKVNIDTPVVDIKGPEAPNVDANLEKLKLSELFNFSGSKIKSADVNTSADFEISPDVNVKAPTVKGGIDLPNANVSGPEVKTGFNTPELDATAEVKESPKSKLRWPFKWGLKSGSNTDEEETDSESDVLNAEMEMPVFKTHRLPRSSIDGIGGIGDTLNLSKLDTEAKDYVVSKGIRLPIVNATSKAGGKVDIMERLRMANKRTSPASISPTDAKSDIDLNLAAPSLDVSASTEADSSLMRGGTFKVEKPESVLGLVAPEISTSDENDKLSLSLSNMLCLNKQSESE